MDFFAAFRRAAVACATFVAFGAVTQAGAEQFNAAPLQAREVGPYIAAQSSPVPNGGWQQSDDRMLDASISGQVGWQISPIYASRIDQEIATGIAHSGGHSWRLSNWFHNGYVNPILSPQFASVGETGTPVATNGDPGSLGGNAQSNHLVYEFWFRSAAPNDANPDPGSFISAAISDAPGNRMTYLSISDEVPGPNTSATDGCPTDNGCFHVDAVEVTSGNDALDDGDATFVDHYSPPLMRGVWYRARIDATFVDGPGAITTDPSLCPANATCHTGNDQIHYQIFDGNGNVVFDTGNIGSWEAAYYDGRYGNPVGTVVASDYAAFRDSDNADNGTQQPYDTYSVNYRPHGDYIDDLSVTPDVGAGIKTSFDYDRYVNGTTGSDTTDCSVQTNPCQTIAYAISQSNPYDTIHVAAGVYAERSSAGENLVITKPVAIEGAQVGVDARTRDLNGSNDASETILVPGVEDTNLTLATLAESAVVTINSAGVSLDGLVIDGDNANLTSTINLNGANPDADSGVFDSGSNTTVQNVVLRNFGGSGIFACNDISTCGSSAAVGDNVFQHNRFTNITDPSSWGIGIYAGDDFYAQINDNLFDQVRVGIQFAENDHLADAGVQLPAVQRNEIHATHLGLFQNLFYQTATTWTVADNSIFASVNASEATEWRGFNIESMQDAQTSVISGNMIDGSALAGSGRNRVGYVLNNWTSSQAANTAISGGSVSNADVGVLVTDASYYTGPVDGALIQGIAFSNLTLGAVYIEDTNQQSGSAAATIGPGNNYVGVPYELVLAGATPSVSFSGVGGVNSVLVRASGNYYYGGAGSSYGPCNPTPCTVANASINTGIAAANPGATVYIEHGTFDETVVIGTGKDGLRLTASDPNNPPTLMRASGGPNQPVLVVAGTPFGPSPGAAPKNVGIDHLNFAVDKTFAGEGILANGFVDGLFVYDNQFVQSWSNTSAKAKYSFTNAISVNIDSAHNSLGLNRVDGSNVTIANNTIAGSTTPNATMFRAGIAVDGSVGSISGNTSSGLNHDAIVRFATTISGGGNGWTITGNAFGGGGLEFDAPNAGITPIAISGNTITAASVPPAILAPELGVPQTSVEADFSVLRLIDNFQKLPVTVSGNTFAGYANGLRGALVENFPNATFSDNTFSPLAGATDFVSLVVSNKEINTDNPPETPYPMSFTALQNTFNGSGVANAGRAVEFIDDNDANSTASFGTISFGDNTAANANSFDPNHKYYFNLVDQNCDTRVPPGTAPQCTFLDYNDVGSVQNTQGRPFRGNVYAVNNLFGGVAPRAMSPLQQAQLNQQTNDINDDTALGYVDYGFTGAVVLNLQGPVANVQVGVPADYSAELTNTGNSLAENVLVQFTVSRTGGIGTGDLTLQYFDGSQYQTIPLSVCGSNLCGTFGPQPGGFALPAGYDATTPLRATFAVADTYTVHAAVQGVSSAVTYAAGTLSTQVVQSAAAISLALNGPQTGLVAGVTQSGYTAQLSNTGGATTENVLVDFVLTRSGGFAANTDAVIAYNTGSGYAAIPLTLCHANQLCGSFGPQPNGFPVGAGYNATTQLQFTSIRAGAITLTANVDGVSTNTQYASSSLTVQVNAAAAANIAANSATSVNGSAGGAASPLPSVVVTDQYGNPVSGYSVAFMAGANSGVLSGSTQATSAAGIATLGGWTLGTAASQTVTVTASGLSGSPVTFTAAASAQFDLAVTFPSVNAGYVQFGKTLDYTFVVSNDGASTASNTVSGTLPPELSMAATWICYANTSGASCGAASGATDGNGHYSDTPTIPAGGSVTYVLTTTVLATPADDTVTNQVGVDATGDSNPANNTTTWTTQIVIFRDGFEVGGNGALETAQVMRSAGTMSAQSDLALNPAQAPQAKTPTPWLRAIDAQGREVFRIDVLQASGNSLARIVISDVDGNQTPGAWMPALQSALSLAGGNGNYSAMLASNKSTLKLPIPAWVSLPVRLYVAD